jgi:hypothetical protein
MQFLIPCGSLCGPSGLLLLSGFLRLSHVLPLFPGRCGALHHGGICKTPYARPACGAVANASCWVGSASCTPSLPTLLIRNFLYHSGTMPYGFLFPNPLLKAPEALFIDWEIFVSAEKYSARLLFPPSRAHRSILQSPESCLVLKKNGICIDNVLYVLTTFCMLIHSPVFAQFQFETIR